MAKSNGKTAKQVVPQIVNKPRLVPFKTNYNAEELVLMQSPPTKETPDPSPLSPGAGPEVSVSLWRVSLHFSPDKDIEAKDEKEAFEKYCKVCGILSTENIPVIRRM